MARPRPSLSPSRFSEGEFRNFKHEPAHAAKEKLVSESVIPLIEGKTGDARCRSGGISFTNLDHLTDGTLVAGSPDVFYCASAEQLNRQIRNDLSGSIIYYPLNTAWHSNSAELFPSSKRPGRISCCRQTASLLRRCARSERLALLTGARKSTTGARQQSLYDFIDVSRWHPQSFHKPSYSAKL